MDEQQTGVAGSSTAQTSIGVQKPGCSSLDFNYVRREKMEEMFSMYRQHVVSDMSGLCHNLKTYIVDESRRQEAKTLQTREKCLNNIRNGTKINTRVRASNLACIPIILLKKQKNKMLVIKHFLINKKKWFNNNRNGMKCNIKECFNNNKNYMKISIWECSLILITILLPCSLIWTTIDDKNENVMNHDLESKLEAIACSQLQDVPSSSSGQKSLYQ
ncbi:uncharacterized protein LOC111391906 [Olea europaea var. sylvestris]|uniref:uncharacterized protein LOC111391906 n=1 Tax=Olea europaea var. sylvestris TaxID=158386 RepID=UPI000C1CD19D|nr:uncharacterized protein LOC111391906 [Olea europaea var. sylvestris]